MMPDHFSPQVGGPSPVERVSFTYEPASHLVVGVKPGRSEPGTLLTMDCVDGYVEDQGYKEGAILGKLNEEDEGAFKWTEPKAMATRLLCGENGEWMGNPPSSCANMILQVHVGWLGGGEKKSLPE